MTEQQQPKLQQINVLDSCTGAKDQVTNQSTEHPSHLFVIGYASNEQLKSFFVEHIARQQAPSDDTVIFYACPLEPNNNNNNSDIVARIETYSDGDLLGEKEYSNTNSDNDNGMISLDEIQSDMMMFVMAELFAHKFADQLPGDDEDEDEDDEDGDDEDDSDFVDDEEEDDEDDRDDEEGYEEDEEDDGEEEDGDDVDEANDEDDEENGADEGETIVLTHITQQDLQPTWNEVFESLNNNSLAYTTFRNSIGGILRDVLFINNPVMKMMAQIADPHALERRDLIELIQEAIEASDATSGNRSEESQDAVAVINPVLSEEQKQEALNVIDLKRQFVQQSVVSDEFQYFLQLESEEDGEDEQVEENREKQSDGAVKQHEQQQRMEWKVFGADLQRLHIGDAFSIGRRYRGQFRIVVDTNGNSLQYHLFDFEHDEVSDKELAENVDNVKRFIWEQSQKFKNGCKRYRMRIPFEHITGVHYHESKIDPGLALLVLDLSHIPEFATRVVTGTEWTPASDFTVGQVASKIMRHFIVGTHDELFKVLSLVLSANENVEQVYGAKRLQLVVPATLEPTTATATTEEQGKEQEEATPFAHLNDDGSTPFEEDATQQQQAASMDGRECIVM